MDDDFIKALHREEQRLKAELERTPAYRRLQAIQTVIEAYQAGSPKGILVGKSETAAKPSQVVPTVKAGTKTAKIMDAVVEYLRTKRARATSGELLKVVVGKGIAVGGKVPSATMASYLSNSALLDNVAGKGYGLKEWGGSAPNDKDPDAGAAESLFK